MIKKKYRGLKVPITVKVVGTFNFENKHDKFYNI